MDHTNNTTDNMPGPNTDPTTASASEPRSPPAADNPRTDDDMSRAVRISFYLGSTTIIVLVRCSPTTPNANPPTPRTAYHRRHAAATLKRIIALEPLGLTEEVAEGFGKRELMQMLRICTVRQAAGISQETEIKYLVKKLARASMLECPEFPEFLERFTRGELDGEREGEAGEEMGTNI